MITRETKTPEALASGAAGSFSRLTWISLVGLLPSRAQLRFTRHCHYTSNRNSCLKIDKSAYRVGQVKTVKSAYRRDGDQQTRLALDKTDSCV